MKPAEVIRHTKSAKRVYAYVQSSDNDGAYWNVAKAEIKYQMERIIEDDGADTEIRASVEEDNCLYIN